MPTLVDDILNSRIVLFFIGLAFFIKILGSTQDNNTKDNKHYDLHNEVKDHTIKYLLSEIEDLKREKNLLKEQLQNSIRVEQETDTDG